MINENRIGLKHKHGYLKESLLQSLLKWGLAG